MKMDAYRRFQKHPFEKAYNGCRGRYEYVEVEATCLCDMQTRTG